MANQQPRVIPDIDRRRIWKALEAHARTKDMSALRTLALVQITADTGLRLSEILAVDCMQLIEDVHAPATRTRIVGDFVLKATQAKGAKTTSRKKGYTSAGAISLPRRSRAALLAYLRALRSRGWLRTWKGSPWITCKGADKRTSHHPVGQRAVQKIWREWQRRAGIREPYRWHDLRHTAITRWSRTSNGDVFAVAALARHRNIRTTQRYVHLDPSRLSEIAARASEL